MPCHDQNMLPMELTPRTCMTTGGIQLSQGGFRVLLLTSRSHSPTHLSRTPHSSAIPFATTFNLALTCPLDVAVVAVRVVCLVQLPVSAGFQRK